MATNVSTMYHRYFIYSAEEESLMLKVNPGITFGTVSVRGVPKRYTSIVRDPAMAKADAIVLLQGDIRKIKYTTPQKNKIQ